MATYQDENTYRYGRSYRGRIQLRRVPLNSGGYTRRGEYFGVGAPLFRYYSEDEVEPANAFSSSDGYFEGYVRGADRAAAIAKLRTAFVQARFPGDKARRNAAAKPNARRNAAPEVAGGERATFDAGAMSAPYRQSHRLHYPDHRQGVMEVVDRQGRAHYFSEEAWLSDASAGEIVRVGKNFYAPEWGVANPAHWPRNRHVKVKREAKPNARCAAKRRGRAR